MNLVGLTTGPATAAVKDLKGKWFETIKPEELEPRDLHAAQLDRRLGRAPPPPAEGVEVTLTADQNDPHSTGKPDGKAR